MTMVPLNPATLYSKVCADFVTTAESNTIDGQTFAWFDLADDTQHQSVDSFMPGATQRSGIVQVSCHGEGVFHVLAHRQAAE